ncbi:MAG: hypothetical protein IT169_05395 [Bryobacterales bacterium]|nr:hypothetical protein [Bryobacterales bacterium]
MRTGNAWGKTMTRRARGWGLCVLATAIAAMPWPAPAQALSPAASQDKPGAKEARRVYIVTLTRDGFEPRKLGLAQGSFTLLVRDLAGSFDTRMELRRAGAAGAALATRKQDSRRLLMNEVPLDLAPGEYVLQVADSRDRQLAITVSAGKRGLP